MFSKQGFICERRRITQHHNPHLSNCLADVDVDVIRYPNHLYALASLTILLSSWIISHAKGLLFGSLFKQLSANSRHLITWCLNGVHFDDPFHRCSHLLFRREGLEQYLNNHYCKHVDYASSKPLPSSSIWGCWIRVSGDEVLSSSPMVKTRSLLPV